MDEPDDALRLAREIADAYGPRSQQPDGPDQAGKKRRRPTRTVRPQREDATSVGDVLGELVQEQGWADQLAATRVFTDWADIVGPEVSQHCKVVEYSDSIVHIAAESTAWKKQLEWLAPRIVAKLNEQLGDGKVLRIEVSGPQAPSWVRGKRSVRGGRGPRDTYG